MINCKIIGGFKINKIIMILFVGLLLIGTVSAATYYVSNSGNDANSGTSESSPWKTISKVNGFALQPGDTVLFKRGDLWREILNPSRSGSSSSPIIFGAYGTGARPIITGADPVGSWVLHSGNIWKATVSTQPQLVWFNGIDGYKRNSLSELTSANDWYWSANILYVYSVTMPTGVESGNRDAALQINSRNYLTFQDIELRYSDQTWGGLIHITSSSNINFNRVSSHDSNDRAFYAYQSNHITIENSEIYGNRIRDQRYGTVMVLENDNYVTIRNSTLKETYSWGGDIIFVFHTANTLIENNYIAGFAGNLIYVQQPETKNTTIRWNRLYMPVDYPGNQGIQIRIGPDNTRVYGNIIYGYFGGPAIQTDGDVSNDPNDGTEIYNNALYLQGSDGNAISVYQNNINAKVYNNIIYTNSGFALLIHSGSLTTLSDNNIFYGPSAAHIQYNGQNYPLTTSGCNAYKAASGKDANSKCTNPLYISPTTGNLMLQNNSPAINAGRIVNNYQWHIYDKDIIGNARGADGTWDIGAYEYGSSGTTTNFHPADTNQDGCISLSEISAYVGLWMQGSVTLSQASSAVSTWVVGCQ